MKKLERVRWDSIIMNLVDIKLRNRSCDDYSESCFDLEWELKRIAKFQDKRSPEEFQAYLRGLFYDRGPVFKYHWYFSSRRKSKNQYYEINS